MRLSVRLVSELLGRAVTEAERGMVATLNDVPDSMLSELRAAMVEQGPGRMSWCLLFFVENVNPNHAAEFAFKVVKEGRDAATYGIGDVIYVPSIYYKGSIITADASELRAELDSCDGERWYTDTMGKLQDGSGLPGVLVRDHRYWQHPPGKVVQIGPQVQGPFVSVSDFDIGVRRWIARRMAWFVSKRASFTDFTAEVALDVMREGRAVEPSRDARIAADALVREWRLDSPRFPHYAGYIGPDDWYR